MSIKWFWTYSGNLESVEAQKSQASGLYPSYRKGRQITYYAENLFDTQLEAYEWKLSSINTLIDIAELEKQNLFNKMAQDGIVIGNN